MSAHPFEGLSDAQKSELQNVIRKRIEDLPGSVYDESVLLEYTMVLLGNKKNRAQIENDLEPFLQSETKGMVEWCGFNLIHLRHININLKHTFTPELVKQF